MDNLIELAMQIIFCLLIAAILGAIIGYLLGKMSRCDDDDYVLRKKSKKLHDYNEDDFIQEIDNNDKNPEVVIKTESVSSVVSGVATDKKEINPFNETDSNRPIGQEVGIRPPSIDQPEISELDDLKEISGIGLKIEEVLHSLGIYRFEQIAHWTPENIDWIENYLTFKGRIKKEDWLAQAKLLSAGGHTEFSKKVRQNDNKNY